MFNQSQLVTILFKLLDFFLDQILDNMKLEIRVDDLMPFRDAELVYARTNP